MRRVLALGSVAMLLAALLPASTSAAESTHLKLTRTGAIVSFAEIRDGLWITTELSASSEASRQIETGPFVFINQAAYAMDEDGNQTAIGWTVNGSTTDFAQSIANGPAAATVDIPARCVERCDAEFTCEQVTIEVHASFTGAGPLQHSHQRTIGTISKQSKFLYNSVGAFRFATAAVTVDGVTFGPTTGPADANIYDTKTGTIDMNMAKPGESAAFPAGVTVFDTTETPVGRRTGQTMFANWQSVSDGVGRNTVLFGSSQRISSKGTVVNITSVNYAEQVYTVDEFGNQTVVSDTFSGDGGTASSVAVDKFLDTGTIVGATIPVTACTYIGDDVFCVDSSVTADGQWTGVGAMTKTKDGTTAGTAGQLLITSHSTGWHRQATATATIDGVTFSNPIEGFVDRATIGFHEVRHTD